MSGASAGTFGTFTRRLHTHHERCQNRRPWHLSHSLSSRTPDPFPKPTGHVSWGLLCISSSRLPSPIWVMAILRTALTILIEEDDETAIEDSLERVQVPEAEFEELRRLVRELQGIV